MELAKICAFKLKSFVLPIVRKMEVPAVFYTAKEWDENHLSLFRENEENKEGYNSILTFHENHFSLEYPEFGKEGKIFPLTKGFSEKFKNNQPLYCIRISNENIRLYLFEKWKQKNSNQYFIKYKKSERKDLRTINMENFLTSIQTGHYISLDWLSRKIHIFEKTKNDVINLGSKINNSNSLSKSN